MGKTRFTLAAIALFLSASAIWLLMASPTGDVEAAGAPHFKMVVPGLSRNRAPTPVPTVGTGDRRVTVFVDVLAHELSLQAGGLTDVQISAAADAELPGTFDSPVTVTGNVTVFVVHPVDSVGCTWTRVFADDTFTMTVSQPQGMDLSVLINFDGPTWHYDVACPGPFFQRVPAFGEESLTGFLGFAFAGKAGPGGMVVQTPVFSGAPDCIKREGVETGSNILADATVTVDVYEPPCLLPVPLP